MRDERVNEQPRTPPSDPPQDQVITPAGLRDGAAARGPVSEEHTVAPTSSVRREPARNVHDDVEIPEAYNLDRDRVRWGPILAGLATALTSLLLLSVLGLAVGLTAIDAERAAAEGGIPFEAGVGTAIWGALSALIAFGLGGWVAGRSAAIFDRGWGALNGALVFLVAVPLILWLATAGVGGILGTIGDYAAGLNIDQARLQEVAQQVQGEPTQVTPQEVGRAAENARDGAWSVLVGLVLGLGASAIAGAAAVRRKLTLDTTQGQRRIVE